MNEFPVIDLHCDLLSYLTLPNSSAYNSADIGCSIPDLQAGNVGLQVLAIFAATEKDSHLFGLKQADIFRNLPNDYPEFIHFKNQDLVEIRKNNQIGVIASLENASAFCDEDMPLKEGLAILEQIIETTESIFYIGFTHHAENRFGGGNFSSAGLKNDGKALLDYLHQRNIAVDFSHTSDALAYEILDYITTQNLAIPILASHSNYRPVYDHPRNLPDEIAQEIIHQKGLIGLNFVRAFVDPNDSDTLMNHIQQGLTLGGENSICYGADYFYTKSHPDKSRIPFYHASHDNASKYAELNKLIASKFGNTVAKKISFENAWAFMEGSTKF